MLQPIHDPSSSPLTDLPSSTYTLSIRNHRHQPVLSIVAIQIGISAAATQQHGPSDSLKGRIVVQQGHNAIALSINDERHRGVVAAP